MSDALNTHLVWLSAKMAESVTRHRIEPARFGAPAMLREMVDKLVRARNAATSTRPKRDQMREALLLMLDQGPAVALARYPRHLCWALLEPWPDHPGCLLADDVRFPQLVVALHTAFLRPSAWCGLLDTFFRYSPGQEPQAIDRNWRLLRSHLRSTLPALFDRPPAPPDWLQLLNDHRNLLEEDPCRRYASTLLDDNEDSTIIGHLKDALSIPEISWFWPDLLRSRLKVATDAPDQLFRKTIGRLLADLSTHVSVRDEGLTRILNRYERAEFKTEIDHGLRDFAIHHWGSPHLKRNEKWGLINRESLTMVRKWIVDRAIKDFFSLLQDTRTNDTRRLKFWLRYQNSIEYFHFALGPAAAESREHDYIKIRKTYGSHISKLSRPGSNQNNAFILSMGNYVFVEFGVTGNACYVYHSDSKPFDYDSSHLDLQSELKVSAKVVAEEGRGRWFHSDGHEKWETKFESALGRLGIYPDRPELQHRSQGGSTRPEQVRVETPRPPANPPPGSPDWIDRATALAARHKLKTHDGRHLGGAYWIMSPQHELPYRYDEEFKLLGFRYIEGRGWWRK